MLCLIPRFQLFQSVKKLPFQVPNLLMATRPKDQKVMIYEAPPSLLHAEATVCFPPEEGAFILVNSILLQLVICLLHLIHHPKKTSGDPRDLKLPLLSKMKPILSSRILKGDSLYKAAGSDVH
jgi:hypothetical protein